MWVSVYDVPKLGILFPSEDGEQYLMGFPLSFPMGWTESPKICTASIETVADISNNDLSCGQEFVPHRLDAQSEAKVAPLDSALMPGPISSIARLTLLQKGHRPKTDVQ
jgi:hypothetical protein